jgi:hypothetical protein
MFEADGLPEFAVLNWHPFIMNPDEPFVRLHEDYKFTRPLEPPFFHADQPAPFYHDSNTMLLVKLEPLSFVFTRDRDATW